MFKFEVYININILFYFILLFLKSIKNYLEFMSRFIDVLNDNGLIENFYSLLWLKPDTAENIIFDFRLPNTIVFKDHCPASWYFSDNKG